MAPSRKPIRAEEAENLSESTAATAVRLADADGGRCSRRLSMPLLRTGQLLTHLLPSLLTEPRLEDGDDRTLAIRPANLVEAPRSSDDLGGSPKISGDLGEVTQPRRRSAMQEGRGGKRRGGFRLTRPSLAAQQPARSATAPAAQPHAWRALTAEWPSLRQPACYGACMHAGHSRAMRGRARAQAGELRSCGEWRGRHGSTGAR